MDILYVLNNLAHEIGIALGVGGATIAFLIHRKMDKDKQSAETLMPLIESISKIIFFGLLLLIVSGIGLIFTVKWPMNTSLLIVKHIFVVIILINGVYLGRMSKKISKIKEKSLIEKLKKKMKTFGAINLILWYLIMVLSVII